MSRRAGVLLALASFVACDVLLAQLVKRVWPLWDPAASEARYRIPSALYHHDLAPLVDTRGVWGHTLYRMRTNSLGFKDSTARIVPRESPGHRMLVIGDSFAEGVGFEFDETFVGIIARELGGRGIEVLNAAVASYAPAIYYRKVKYLIEERNLGFDELVVFLDISDIYEEALFYDFEDDVVQLRPTAPAWARGFDGWRAADEESATKAVRSWLASNSVAFHLGNLVAERWSGGPLPEVGAAGHLPRTNLKRAHWTLNPRYYEEYGREGLARAGADMERLLALLAPRSVELAVVVYPWPDQVAFDDRDSLQVSFWRGWCAARGVRFVNLFPPFFAGGTARERVAAYFIPSDIHLSRAGHELMARSFLSEYPAPAPPRPPARESGSPTAPR